MPMAQYGRRFRLEQFPLFPADLLTLSCSSRFPSPGHIFLCSGPPSERPFVFKCCLGPLLELPLFLSLYHLLRHGLLSLLRTVCQNFVGAEHCKRCLFLFYSICDSFLRYPELPGAPLHLYLPMPGNIYMLFSSQIIISSQNGPYVPEANFDNFSMSMSTIRLCLRAIIPSLVKN